jgi:hypothetical protein
MKIATCDVQARGNSRLLMALKTMELMNTCLVLLMETKLVKDSHTFGGWGHAACATESKNTHQGGVALCCREAKDWHMQG